VFQLCSAADLDLGGAAARRGAATGRTREAAACWPRCCCCNISTPIPSRQPGKLGHVSARALVALGLGEIRGWSAAQRWWPTLATAAVSLLIAKAAWARYRGRTPNTPERDGARSAGRGSGVHLAEPMRAAYRVLALNAVVHGDMLFSEPGMFSFNSLDEPATPTGRKHDSVVYAPQ